LAGAQFGSTPHAKFYNILAMPYFRETFLKVTGFKPHRGSPHPTGAAGSPTRRTGLALLDLAWSKLENYSGNQSKGLFVLFEVWLWTA
jgi:hypothetical protein